LVKLASFECNYKKEKMYHANEEQAMDKVKEWREECD
jgi:hypothetical protein